MKINPSQFAPTHRICTLLALTLALVASPMSQAQSKGAATPVRNFLITAQEFNSKSRELSVAAYRYYSKSGEATQLFEESFRSPGLMGGVEFFAGARSAVSFVPYSPMITRLSPARLVERLQGFSPVALTKNDVGCVLALENGGRVSEFRMGGETETLLPENWQNSDQLYVGELKFLQSMGGVDLVAANDSYVVQADASSPAQGVAKPWIIPLGDIDVPFKKIKNGKVSKTLGIQVTKNKLWVWAEVEWTLYSVLLVFDRSTQQLESVLQMSGHHNELELVGSIRSEDLIQFRKEADYVELNAKGEQVSVRPGLFDLEALSKSLGREIQSFDQLIIQSD